MILKNKLLFSLLSISIIVAAAACGGDDDDDAGDDGVAFGLRSDVVAEGDLVSDIAFAPDGRIFFAEQYSGNIRVIQADGTLQEEPFATLDVITYITLDWGLTSIALDPGFESNGYVYAFFTRPEIRAEPPDGPTGRPTIVRFTDDGSVGTDETVITEDFPETPREHPDINGNGKIRFGPDGYLYASIGDYDYNNYDDPANFAQDPGVPIGALLRLDPEDGSAPPDNPFVDDPDADPRVFAYGFREPFPFDFHPETGTIYGTDNTTVSCEELNIIEAGANYGWPAGEFPYADCNVGEQGRVIHHFARDGMQPGDFVSFVEISGLTFTSAARYPALGDALVVCESWRSPDTDDTRLPGVLRLVVLTGAEFDEVTSTGAITRDCRTAAAAPDGTIYYATDTEIRRLEVGDGDAGNGGDNGGNGNGDAPTQPVPPPLSTP